MDRDLKEQDDKILHLVRSGLSTSVTSTNHPLDTECKANLISGVKTRRAFFLQKKSLTLRDGPIYRLKNILEIFKEH
ncbi:unnamed protein product [Allacma fusca]|uniref:Uncharacterized protein n=1 Tax=Allacma fusca TaxID=39272 RepID=A0A8J2JTP8_9HEXA|nr:unnamed protein product [Allacma fusca]